MQTWTSRRDSVATLVKSDCVVMVRGSVSAVRTLLMALALGSAGCYTTRLTVTLEPHERGYPVSASSRYVDRAGRIVDEEQYEMVDTFEFERVYSAPRHEATSASMTLDPELTELMTKHHGDAVTNVRIVGHEHDPGSHSSAAIWKSSGWVLGVTGAGFFVTGLTLDDAPPGTAFVRGGLLSAGLGALCFLFAEAADTPSEWRFRVTGQVVQRHRDPEALPPTSPSIPGLEEPSLPLEAIGYLNRQHTPRSPAPNMSPRARGDRVLHVR